jgi:hypothetical protein
VGNHHYVTSSGSPYFVFEAATGGVNTLPSLGLVEVAFRFRVNLLPVMKVDANEIHPFFAFDHDTQTQPSILHVGITPAGAVVARAKSYNAGTNPLGQWKSSAGAVSANGAWNTLSLTYGVQAAGNWDVTLNGTKDTSVTDPAPQTLLPGTGYETRLRLFNGQDALARTDISIESASATFVGAQTSTYSWDFHEHAGTTLTPTNTGSPGASELPWSGTMLAGWLGLVLFPPWGVVPTEESSPSSSAYEWAFSTDHTRLVPPVTNYSRVAG